MMIFKSCGWVFEFIYFRAMVSSALHLIVVEVEPLVGFQTWASSSRGGRFFL